jgi:hypothetical protein
MIIRVKGHVYELDQIGSEQHQVIKFVNKEPGMEEPGVTTQEILRMLIDRTHYCHNCLPHRVNEAIIWHFRQAIALHEARAIEQKAAKGEILPELIGKASDGHFAIRTITPLPQLLLGEYTLKPVPPLGHFECDHRSAANQHGTSS